MPRVIVMQTDGADYEYVVRRVGKVVIVSTESPACARALVRRIDDALVGSKQEPDREGVTQAIGFRADSED